MRTCTHYRCTNEAAKIFLETGYEYCKQHSYYFELELLQKEFVERLKELKNEYGYKGFDKWQ